MSLRFFHKFLCRFLQLDDNSYFLFPDPSFHITSPHCSSCFHLPMLQSPSPSPSLSALSALMDLSPKPSQLRPSRQSLITPSSDTTEATMDDDSISQAFNHLVLRKQDATAANGGTRNQEDAEATSSSIAIQASRRRAFFTRSLSQPPLYSSLKAAPRPRQPNLQNLPPCYVACFSPLELPLDIFVCLLDFLSPSDMWRLCQVSRTMHLAILQSMTRAQRFRYDATRILHQDHAIENPAHGPPQQRRGSTMYDSYTPTDSVSAGKPSHTKVTGTLAQQNASPSSSSSSSLATSAIHPQQQLYQYYLYHQNPQLQQQLQKQHQQQLKEMAGGGRIQDRCQYWTAQANLLVTSMAVGTEFEPKSESDAQQEKDLGKELSPHKAAHASASVSRDSMPPQPPSYSADHTPSQNQNQSHNHDLDQDHDHDQSQDPDNVVSHLPAANTSSSTFTLASESSVSLASTSTAVPPENQTTSSLSFFARTFVLTPIPKTFNGKVEPLLMERFQSMVDLIFDPCLVPLSYRRAIINCARYVSADIDKIFPNAIETTILRVEPLEPVLLAHFTKICTIQLGPYLSMLTPNQFDEDGLELSLRAQQRLERTATSTIEPPKRLVNYFQMMLWHRCMHDLIVIYNKLQDRHTRSFEVSSSSVKQQKSSTTTTAAAASSLQPKPPVCCQDTAVSSSLSSTPTVPFSTYPFCCEAHSLVFTSPYPTSMVPYPLRLRFRRMAQKVQTVSQHALWLMAMGGMGQRAGSGLSSSFNMDTMPPDQNVIRNLGANNKIRFCNGSVHPPMVPSPSTPSSSKISTSDNAISGHQQRQQSQHNPCQHDDEASLQRRYEIEERIRQDNKIKQELLGLCHMACGLFLIHTSTIHQHLHHHRRSPDAPPTIMSLLRYGSPWKKGIWREGEWRHDPIELGQASPTTMASGDSSRQHGSGRAKKNGQANLADQGPWQKMCIATIQFLAHEDLAWGGSRTNAELSRLRATSEANAWVYHE